MGGGHPRFWTFRLYSAFSPALLSSFSLPDSSPEPRKSARLQPRHCTSEPHRQPQLNHLLVYSPHGLRSQVWGGLYLALTWAGSHCLHASGNWLLIQCSNTPMQHLRVSLISANCPVEAEPLSSSWPSRVKQEWS